VQQAIAATTGPQSRVSDMVQTSSFGGESANPGPETHQGRVTIAAFERSRSLSG
jgi:hypothetical protein